MKANINIYIQARMGSVRFPGKSFHIIKNKPCLQHLIESLLQFFSKKNIIVLTSKNKENSCIRNYCNKININCLSGDELNVSERFYNALRIDKNNYFARICGDSPLFSAFELFKFIKNNPLTVDLYSTIIDRTFPKGNNFEIISKDIFLENYKNFNKSHHYEHVTKYFYENSCFNIKSINLENNRRDVNLCFDDGYDLKILERIFDKLSKPHYSYSLEEKCSIYYDIINERKN